MTSYAGQRMELAIGHSLTTHEAMGLEEWQRRPLVEKVVERSAALLRLQL